MKRRFCAWLCAAALTLALPRTGAQADMLCGGAMDVLLEVL